MVKVTAFLCEDTDQLFRHESDYLKHRRRYLADKKQKAKFEQDKQNLQLYFDSLRLSINSFDDLKKVFTVDYFKHCTNIIKLKKPLRHLEFGPGLKSLESYLNKHSLELNTTQDNLDFTLTLSRRDEFSFKISNSHDCPVGGVINWCGHDKSKPDGYPGVRGEIKLDCPGLDGHTITSGFESLAKGLNLISGAGGAGTFHYASLYMFSADWPFLAKIQIIDALSEAVRYPSLFADVAELGTKFFPDVDLVLCNHLIRDQKLSKKDATLFINTVFDKRPSSQVLNLFHVASIKDCLPDLGHMFDVAMSKEIKSEPLPVIEWEV